MSDEQWHVFGQRSEVSYKELTDVGRALFGLPPVYHEWVQISPDRTGYRVGPKISPQDIADYTKW